MTCLTSAVRLLCPGGLASILVVGMSLLAAPPAQGQQVLTIDNLTLDNYRAADTRVQRIDGLRTHATASPLSRGCYLDGSAGGGSAMFGLAVGTGEAWNSGGMIADVRLATGTISRVFVDCALPAPEFSWVIGRTFNPAQKNSTNVSDGYQGSNWHQASQPEIYVYVDAGNHANDRVYLVTGAESFAEFQREGTSSVLYDGVNGAAGMFEYVAGSPDTWVYHEPSGRNSTFFGGNTGSNRGNGQLWKIETAAGNMAYVGDPSNMATAVTSGYDTSGRITTAYDAADRRYSYTYASFGGTTRLQTVVVETKTSGTWASPSGVTQVTTVDYDYYTSTVTDQGTNGDLKTVTVVRPLTDSTSPLSSSTIKDTAIQYYRYYDNRGWSNSAGRRGDQHTLKLVLDPEAVRAYGLANLGAASDSTLEPYATAYYEYRGSGDSRLKTFMYNGQCGCGGGSANGTYTIVSAVADPNYTKPGTYDALCAYRVVVQQPDAHYVTHYFDTAGQLLWRVATAGDPSSAPGNTWAWKGTRSSSTGAVSTLESPANITAYSYGVTTLTSSSSAGRIEETSRLASTTAFDGLANTNCVKQGTSGSTVDVTDRDYPTSPRQWQIATGKYVTPVMIEKSRTSANGSSWDATNYSYTFWSSSPTSPLYIRPKQITTELPVITTGNNGPGGGTGVIDYRYIRKDGTTAFTVNANGIVSYTKYNALGLTEKQIQDADTSSGDIAGADSSDFSGVTSAGTEFHLLTTYTYDNVGRVDTVTRPDGRVSKMYYSKLSDGRLVTLSIPRVSGGYYYGPVGYTVSNQAGRTVMSGMIAISNSGSNAGLSTWIDETVSDPITAVTVGTLARMSTSIYSNDGSRVTASRAYHTIPGSGAGSAGTNYDESTFEYDEMGRQSKSVTPAGTISRTVFDELGRTIARWIGTDDTSFSSAGVGAPNNMVQVETLVYDGGSAGGNSLVTSRYAFVDSSGSGGGYGGIGDSGTQRLTTYIYDWRDRLKVQVTPLAPITVTDYDNLNRVVATAQYTSSSGLSGTTVAATNGTNRCALSKALYDELGRVYESRRYQIDQSSGAIVSPGGNDVFLTDLTWRDALGQVIKTRGSSLTKMYYDRVNRPTHRFTLASDDDSSTYANAATVSGDYVMNETQTVYENSTGNVLMTVSIDRHAGDLTVTGALDANADGGTPSPTTLTGVDVKGRVSITAMVYDALDRVVDTVQIGTNGIVGNRSSTAGTFNRLSWSAGSRSATELRTTYTYNTDGTLLSVESPGTPGSTGTTGIVTQYLYDQLGRKTVEIRNYTAALPPISTAVRDTDLYTRYTYSAGHMTEMWVDLDGDGTKDTDDQVTTYVYGSAKSGKTLVSTVASNDLLDDVVYPDSGGSSEKVFYAYNPQGQQIQTQDEDGVLITYVYDTLGRLTARKVDYCPAAFDSSVLRIATTYLSRGLVEKITQYDAATSGTVVNEVKQTYDDWGNLTQSEQDKDSAVGGGGNQYTVGWSYAKVGTGDGSMRTTLRRTGMTLPGGDAVDYTFLNATGLLDDAMGRVTEVIVTPSGGMAATASTYQYLGVGRVTSTFLGNNVQDLHNTYSGGFQYSTYPKLDRFGRDLGYVWTDYNGTALYQETVTYDYLGNITSFDDSIKSGRDVKYTLDSLGRLTNSLEGTLSAGSITGGSETRVEEWKNASATDGLSQTGNWVKHKRDLDYNGTYAGTGDITDTGTFTKGNRLDTRTGTREGAGISFTYGAGSYNKRGDLTDDQDVFAYKYDAFGRLTNLSKTGGGATATDYKYDGLGRLIGMNHPSPGEPWYYYVYDDQWRVIATYRSTDSDPKETFVYHNAGLDGRGGSSYIDEVILRDRDIVNDFVSAATGTRGERRYYAQNRHKDVVLLMKDTGRPIERYFYTSYGRPFTVGGADFDNNGTITDPKVTNTDRTAFNTAYGGSDMHADWNLDGALTGADTTEFNNDQVDQTDNGATTGFAWWDVSIGGDPTDMPRFNGNRKGYAGYEFERYVGFYHVRNRVYDPDLGRWTRRDPAGYVDGMSLYQYGGDMPETALDPMGLACCGTGTKYSLQTALAINNSALMIAASSTSKQPTSPLSPLQTACQQHCNEACNNIFDVVLAGICRTSCLTSCGKASFDCANYCEIAYPHNIVPHLNLLCNQACQIQTLFPVNPMGQRPFPHSILNPDWPELRCELTYQNDIDRCKTEHTQRLVEIAQACGAGNVRLCQTLQTLDQQKTQQCKEEIDIKKLECLNNMRR